MFDIRVPDWLSHLFVAQDEDDSPWHKKPLSVLALYLFIAVLAYWEKHIPSPGEAVAALGVAAAAMSIRGEMQGKEKVAWMLLLFAFLSLELTSINTERRANEEMQSQARWQEAQRFQKIGDDISSGLKDVVAQSEQQFKKTIQQQSRQFASTMKIEQQNVDQITGGQSYAIVLPDTTDSTASALQIGITMCITCEESIEGRVYVQEIEFGKAINHNDLVFQGRINPHSMFMMERKLPVLQDRVKIYQISVIARNKPTFEFLKIRFNQEEKHWEFSYSIMREEKQSHLNPKTQMAEGEVLKVLVKDTGWGESRQRRRIRPR